uniref:Uncharacterized protein n=1 Tax=Arion vulgaris TaxID=1028688 RepID=A0A0B7A311_9EUPU
MTISGEETAAIVVALQSSKFRIKSGEETAVIFIESKQIVHRCHEEGIDIWTLSTSFCCSRGLGLEKWANFSSTEPISLLLMNLSTWSPTSG